jgi:hypothetical protein
MKFLIYGFSLQAEEDAQKGAGGGAPAVRRGHPMMGMHG